MKGNLLRKLWDISHMTYVAVWKKIRMMKMPHFTYWGSIVIQKNLENLGEMEE